MSIPETLSTRGGETAAQSWQEEGREARAPSPFKWRDRVLALLPPLWLAYLIGRWGVDLPYFDQWELVPRFLAWSEGSFPWRQIWNLHNEHRLIVPELIMLLVGKLTGWNIRVELWINFLLAVLLFLVLGRLLRHSLSSGHQHSLGTEQRFSALLPLLSLVVFSPSQWGNWSWGWQIQIFLAVLMVAAGILLLSRQPRTLPAFLGAVGCATVASFSFANGLLLFPLGLPLLLRDPKKRGAYAAAWLAAGAAVYWIYGVARIGARAPDQGLNLAEKLYIQANYLLHYLAAPLLNLNGVVTRVAHVVVPLSLLLLAWQVLRHRRLWHPLLPWLTLCAFGLASAAMTAHGRYTFGIGQALSTRYYTIAHFYWLGLIGVLLVIWREHGPRRLPRFHLTAAAALVLCFLANAWIGAADFESDSRERQWVRAALRGETPPRDVAQRVPFPDQEAVRQRIEMLKKLKLSLFR